MTLHELIESNSRKPMAELLKEGAHLIFDDERYAKTYCESHCPHRYADYHWECPGGCKTWDEGMEDGKRIAYGADMLIGEILRGGYQSLGVKGINKPFKIDDSTRDYANMYCEEAYCADCKKSGESECPEDILSAECPRSGDAWAVEHITEAVNDVLKYSL